MAHRFVDAVAVNRFQLELLNRIVADLPADRIRESMPGHGHSPQWILGHLAICADIGMQLCGGQLCHPAWLPIFGPGSVDPAVSSDVSLTIDTLDKATLLAANNELYTAFQTAVAAVDDARCEQAQSFPFFLGTPIQTIGNCLALLLTNHFGFHLSQLSACRRSLGIGPLF